MPKLTPVTELLKNSLKIYFQKQNFLYLVKVLFLGFLIVVLAIAPALIVLSFLGNRPQSFLGWALFLLLTAVSGSWFGAALTMAVIKVAKGKAVLLKETYQQAWLILGRFLGTSLLVFLIIGAGYFLLVIPGLIFQIWLAFAIFVMVTEGSGAFEAIKKSQELVKGYFWPVAGRLLAFMLLSFTSQLVSFIRQLEMLSLIISFLLTPYFVLLPYLLYEDLKRVKES